MILSRATPVLTRRRPHDEDLGGGTRLFDGCVTLGDAARLASDPALALRVVSAAVDRGLPLLPYARDAIAQAASDPAWCAELRRCPEAASRFVELVATCKETALRAGTVVRELHDLGLLLAMIPEFLPVVGRVHHDTYHVYTVDVHSVAAVDRLAALARGELAAEFPLACRLAAETTRPAMLFFATLLHDVGKAIGSRDHSERGAEMASVILARLGLPKGDVDEACHLILKHLTMYLVATRRDLDDRAVIAEFAREVHGREGLRDLYLLTVADLSTTSPTSMTSWKARMLDELYLATDAALAGDMAADDARVARAVAEVIAAAGAPAASEDRRSAAPAPADLAARRAFLAEYLASMPERYVLSNAPLAIVAHAELARAHGAAPPGQISVSLVPSRHPEAAEICVIAADRPGLLAAITAAIAASRLEVHAAQIHSRVILQGAVQAVDIFWVRDRGEGVGGVARAIPKLVRDITDVIAGRVSAAELVRRRGASRRDRSTPQVGTQVVVDDRASGRHTVIEVTTRDRPGLLFAIADALYGLGLSIAVAKINTEGTRVADVFYVSEADGSKVASGPRTTLVHDRILAAIEEQARQHEGSSA
jgi:[protein-PII] uridylyltransferase